MQFGSCSTGFVFWVPSVEQAGSSGSGSQSNDIESEKKVGMGTAETDSVNNVSAMKWFESDSVVTVKTLRAQKV